jgi:hypothetical protein
MNFREFLSSESLSLIGDALSKKFKKIWDKERPHSGSPSPKIETAVDLLVFFITGGNVVGQDALQEKFRKLKEHSASVFAKSG